MDWVITRDRTAELNEATFVGWGRKESFRTRMPVESQELLKWRNEELIFQFQLLNDDGEIDLEGECGDIQNADELDAFEPLDWAADNIGCTELRFRMKGEKKWQTL